MVYKSGHNSLKGTLWRQIWMSSYLKIITFGIHFGFDVNPPFLVTVLYTWILIEYRPVLSIPKFDLIYLETLDRDNNCLND